jgi:hypothetical protein
MTPDRLEITYRINVAEDDHLRDRQLGAIVRLLRTADDPQRKDPAEKPDDDRADPPHEP